jgi:Flp pilus assembly protein TadG
MNKIPKERNNEQSGQSLVEFAVSLVILLLLISGIVDGSRALFTYMALRDAAQEGAVYGAINPTMTASIQDRVYKSSDMLQSIEGVVNVDVTLTGSPCMGNGIQVDVRYDSFPITMPFLGAVLGSQTVAIKASAVDTILSPACT